MNFTSYVEGLPVIKRDKLYDSPWTCQALFRTLSPLAKQYIVRLLFVEEPIAKELVDNWVKPSHKQPHQAALCSLEHLNLFQVAQTSGKGAKPGYILHPAFKQQLTWALAGGNAATHELHEDVLARAPSMEQLDRYAAQQWESLLLFLLDPSRYSPPKMPDYLDVPPLDIKGIMSAAGLFGASGKRSGGVSEKGFQFLLMDSLSQLWEILREYINNAEQKSGGELASVMSFLMQLGFRRVGQPCSWAGLSRQEQAIAGHAVQLGLLYAYRAQGQLWYSPTRLATSLCGGGSAINTVAASAVNSADVTGGYIIVETNYRVYAYTGSPVQVAILQLFCRTDCLLPNLLVGTLTRDTVIAALKSGITADQIATYLQQHGHPQVQHRSPVVPEVVTDQVRLWERDLYRVRAHPAVIYEQFDTPELYVKSCEYARNIGTFLWADHERRRFIGKLEGHEDLKRFIQRLKQGTA